MNKFIYFFAMKRITTFIHVLADNFSVAWMQIPKTINVLLALILFAAAIIGCSSPSSPKPKPSSTATLKELGSISYTLDTSRKDTATYDAASPDYVYLMATDSRGYKWSLYIPPGALLTTQEITMTPFDKIDLSQSESGIISGVQLEPDGLYFSDAARLSVIPPDNSGDPGIGLIFTMQQGGSDVAFAPTDNNENTAMSELWHFSSAGYGNGYSSDGLDALRDFAKKEYQETITLAKMFIKTGAPEPPLPPSISMFCRCTEANPEQGESYEYVQTFISPYDDMVRCILDAMKALYLLSADEVDVSEGYPTAVQVLQMAEKSIFDLGDKCTRETPPDRLLAVISAALRVEHEIGMLGNPGGIPYKVITWAEYLRDSYLDELVNNHDYRAFPVLLTLDKMVQLLGGEGRFEDIMNAMTFEVVVNTSFNATWMSGDQLYQEGNVEQDADVKNIINELEPPDFLWGTTTGQNMILKSTGGTLTEYFENPVKTIPLTGQTYAGSVWLLNWDACVTKTFDVILAGFYGDLSESSAIAGPSSVASFKNYQWNVVGSFIFTVPMVNKAVNFGTSTFSGSGSAAEGAFTSSGTIGIWIVHTPK
jgi:hypothetical protein